MDNPLLLQTISTASLQPFLYKPTTSTTNPIYQLLNSPYHTNATMKTAVPTLLLATLVSSALAAPVTDQTLDVSANAGAVAPEVQALFNAEEDDFDLDELQKRGIFDDIAKQAKGTKDLISAVSAADEIFNGIKKVFDDFKKKHQPKGFPDLGPAIGAVVPSTPPPADQQPPAGEVKARGFIDDVKNGDAKGALNDLKGIVSGAKGTFNEVKGAFNDVKDGVAHDDLLGGLKKAFDDFKKSQGNKKNQKPADGQTGAPPAQGEPAVDVPPVEA
ncbi:hypothetical protein VHEMI04113 [[Torrubiella] hemipterigena]|uniref:Uncharacterized protein n=1 Tax=[Torrubiella] hemipterigena TaxID=1531966 RepID=A0A0A1T0F6_9HYPO|nr:hypothetical protein VHEMI04113 [[Torrubiella] hemipterigena]